MATLPSRMRTVRASDLSRDSAAVFRAAEAGAVEVTRRDAESLILTRKTAFDDQWTALQLAADLVAASLGPDDEPFTARLRARFPWMQFLTPAEQEQFGEEIVEIARGCAAVREFGPFLAELYSWRETAETKAAGYTPTADFIWYDDPVVVDQRMLLVAVHTRHPDATK